MSKQKVWIVTRFDCRSWDKSMCLGVYKKKSDAIKCINKQIDEDFEDEDFDEDILQQLYDQDYGDKTISMLELKKSIKTSWKSSESCEIGDYQYNMNCYDVE